MQSKSKNPEEILRQTNFSEELLSLRKIILSTGLDETIKWGTPVYTHEGKNVVGIAGFNEHFGIWFYQGVLLKDEQKKLINAQAGKTMALRQWRMTSKKDINKKVLVEYIKEAIENEKKGLRVASRKPIKKAPVLPPELKSAVSASKRLAMAFKKLTPGRQKEYAEYIAGAKQIVTRKTRVEKIRPMILAGVGLNDKYLKKKKNS